MMPVTIPVAVIVATDVLLLLQVPALLPPAASVVLLPAHTVVVPVTGFANG